MKPPSIPANAARMPSKAGSSKSWQSGSVCATVFRIAPERGFGLTLSGEAGRHRDDFVAGRQAAVTQPVRVSADTATRLAEEPEFTRMRSRTPTKRANSRSKRSAKRPVISQKSIQASTSCRPRRNQRRGPTPAPPILPGRKDARGRLRRSTPPPAKAARKSPSLHGVDRSSAVIRSG